MSAAGNDIETTTGSLTRPGCGAGFTRARRQRYCSPACRQAAWRERHRGPTDPVTIHRPPSRRAITVYACGRCEQRYHGEQWCPDCQRPCRRIDIGGLCPHCEEPVAITDRLG